MPTPTPPRKPINVVTYPPAKPSVAAVPTPPEVQIEDDPVESFAAQPEPVRSVVTTAAPRSFALDMLVGITVVVYVLLGVVTSILLVLFVNMFLSAESAPQEAAVGAGFAAWFVGSYVVVRSLEKIATLVRIRD